MVKLLRNQSQTQTFISSKATSHKAQVPFQFTLSIPCHLETSLISMTLLLCFNRRISLYHYTHHCGAPFTSCTYEGSPDGCSWQCVGHDNEEDRVAQQKGDFKGDSLSTVGGQEEPHNIHHHQKNTRQQ